MRKNLGRGRGQGMTEYIIIVAVVAILSIGIVLKFGDQIREWFVGSGDALGGGDRGVTNVMDGVDSARGLDDIGN